MSNIEHLIENAIEAVEKHWTFEHWAGWEKQYGNYVDMTFKECLNLVNGEIKE